MNEKLNMAEHPENLSPAEADLVGRLMQEHDAARLDPPDDLSQRIIAALDTPLAETAPLSTWRWFAGVYLGSALGIAACLALAFALYFWVSPASPPPPGTDDSPEAVAADHSESSLEASWVELVIQYANDSPLLIEDAVQRQYELEWQEMVADSREAGEFLLATIGYTGEE